MNAKELIHQETFGVDTNPGPLYFSISLPVLFEEVRSSWCQIRPVLGLLGMSLCVQMAQRAAGSLRARNTTLPKLSKLLSYIPSVKQTHFIKNLWSSYISVIRNLVCHKGQIHPRARVSLMLLILQNMSLFLWMVVTVLLFCIWPLDLHI